MSSETVEKDSKNYPILRNLQYSPLKQGEEQYIVLWDPTGLSSEKLVLPLNYFYLFQFFDGEHSLEQVGGEYLKKYGEFMMPDHLTKLVADLDEKLFLEGDRLKQVQQQAFEAYRKLEARPMAFAGNNMRPIRSNCVNRSKGIIPRRKDRKKERQNVLAR